MFLNNEGASKILALFNLKVSNNTIQRLYDRIEFIYTGCGRSRHR